jgi:glycosyltransferase involved in cell wall biosynthesis
MKQYCVVSCPIDTYSGYGARARDFVKALIQTKGNDWEINIIPQRWGSTPWNYIEDHIEEWGFLQSYFLPPLTTQLPKQPDVWFQITVPNEFQPVGRYNIGVTAGIETTVCDPSWIDGVNRMNLTLVSSEHAKKVFEEINFEQKNEHGQIVRLIKLEKPIEVLFEGVDLNKYFEIPDEELPECPVVNALDSIEESFCYLFVGHWLQGDIGEDRKNVGLMIKTFLETFKNKKHKPALVLKSSGAGSSILDRNEILKRINNIRKSIKGDLPNIYLLHGDITEEEMNYLYNHPSIKAMISLTKGEGFGRPLLEFSTLKKPMIVSGWSGHMDFLNPEFILSVGGDLKPTHPSAYVQGIILKEGLWFSPDIVQVNRALNDVFINYKKYTELAKRQSFKSKNEFSFEKMAEKLKSILDKNVSELPKQVELKLPQLKKVELPKLKKI